MELVSLTSIQKSERRSNMKTNRSWKRFLIIVTLGAALMGVPAFPTVSEAIAADPGARSELSGVPANVTTRKLTADPGDLSGQSVTTEMSVQPNSAVTE